LPPDQTILAFDTSVAHCAAALLSNDEILAERCEDMAKGQAERLFPLLNDLLADCDTDWRDLTAIAVGIGPGNFTGIRISVSAARGLALSLAVPAIGVSTFQALALDLARPVLASLDARRGQTYLQAIGLPGGTRTGVMTDEVPPQFHAVGLTCVGDNSALLARQTGGAVARPLWSLPVAIARAAAARHGQPARRPAPLYVRAPDAAPSRDLPPVMLP